MNGNVNMKQITDILKKNGKELKIIHELIIPRYDEDIIVKVYQEKFNNDNHSTTNKNQFWIACNNDLIPFESVEHLIIMSQHKEIPISAILSIAQVCNLSVDCLHQHSYYKLQYHLYNELNRIDSEKLKEIVIKLLFENNDVIRTDTDAMLFLGSITSSPHFNYEHVNLLLELCQEERQKKKNSIDDEDTLLYEICSSIIQSKLMNPENVSASKEAQRYFNKIFDTFFYYSIRKIDLQHIGFVCTLLQSPLLIEYYYEKIIFQIKRMEAPIDFVLLEKALMHSYVSKEIVDWMIYESKIHYTDVLFNVSNLDEDQLAQLYEKYLRQDKTERNTKEEFVIRYHTLHSEPINDNYINHQNPTIRKFVALSKSLTEEQIDSLIMDNDRDVLVYLVMSHVLSEEQLDKLIEHSHEQVLDEEAIEDISYHIAQQPLISERQLWNMVTSESEKIQRSAAASNSLNKEQLDTLLKSKFDDVRKRATSSLIYALNYHTLDDLKANKTYNKMNGLLFTRLIETLISIG